MANEYFSPDKSDMMAAAIKYNGNISALAEHFNVSRDTMYQYMKRDPQGKEIIQQVRGYNNESMLDLAEHVLRYNLHNYKSNAGLAQRASEKVIDRLGYMRGWLSEKVADQKDENKELLAQKFEEILAQLNAESASSLNIEDSSISNETKS
jgi:transposase-like protein